MASVADAVYVKTAPVAAVASAVAFVGTVTTGPVVSVTVTVNDALLRLPWASLAVHVTVVGASAKVAPIAGARVTAILPSMASVADAVQQKTARVAVVGTIVSLLANAPPRAGTNVSAVLPSMASLAAAAHLHAAPLFPAASAVAFVGTVTTGPVVSVTVTVNDALPRLPWASLAVHV